MLTMNAVLALTTNDSRPKNHRFFDNDQLSLSSKSTLEKKALYELERDKANDEHMENKSEEYTKPWDNLKKTDRVQFQIEGHEGPQTYIFGFDTGRGRNRQFRLEERHLDGTVKGQYGYYDAAGKLRTVQYVAKPFDGYTEKHHESNLRTLKN
ncbi:uncharacterized protein LOC144469191 isoform X2 [Augochlora pura]